jgi:TonB family protein
MKKLILLLLFIPLVSFGQNKNSVLDCDINDNSCFQTLVNQHVLDNFNYPELGSYFNVQAMVYVDYTIDTNGVVGNISSKAALIGVVFEDVESKKNETHKFRTPILYRLIDVEKGLTNSININKINQGIDFLNNLNQDELLSSVADPFEIIDEFPVFPGCEDLKESKKRLCFQYQINEHIRRNFRYPEIAQEKGIQGRVLVQFVLGKDGRVRGLSSSGTTSPALKQEAEIIISLLPKIKPAKKNGLRVVVPFSIPITFKIG